MKKPPWFNKKTDLGLCREMKQIIRQAGISTICQQALCPNISECFNHKTAAFMILGDTCTRDCRFCNVKKGDPCGLDSREPQKIIEAVSKLGLNYVVITSPSRDDLDDFGAGHFCLIVKELKEMSSDINIELLIPDFMAR
ncbi:MAG: hypothetical protein JW867_05340 [Candidatus Omnitrophica bacterium]|nr:hypothetical protein [Candidatus Omnitrophota bacterium]